LIDTVEHEEIEPSHCGDKYVERVGLRLFWLVGVTWLAFMVDIGL
jgi:hypothetical protein